MTEEIKPTQDVSEAEAKAEGQKLEWGPDLDEMNWNDAQEKIKELNSKLSEGEKPWRLPTKDELVAEFKKTGSIPAGFQGYWYWSINTSLVTQDDAYVVHMGLGEVDSSIKANSFIQTHCRLVRDAA